MVEYKMLVLHAFKQRGWQVVTKELVLCMGVLNK